MHIILLLLNPLGKAYFTGLWQQIQQAQAMLLSTGTSSELVAIYRMFWEHGFCGWFVSFAGNSILWKADKDLVRDCPEAHFHCCVLTYSCAQSTTIDLMGEVGGPTTLLLELSSMAGMTSGASAHTLYRLLLPLECKRSSRYMQTSMRMCNESNKQNHMAPFNPVYR